MTASGGRIREVVVWTIEEREKEKHKHFNM